MKDSNLEVQKHTYIAIDLKSFYASAECHERGRNPLTTHLVVADTSRTEKTICLAVSPSLKAYGIHGRSRLFEVVQRVKEVNAERKIHAPGRRFTGESADAEELAQHPELAASYIAATPRMALYMERSTEIYNIYLKYVAPEDIHVYSIDEVFMDVTCYLQAYRLTPRELARQMIHDVLVETGITATAGIGTNLYLCKIAMDMVAKHVPADEDGVRIAELDEYRYRELLWDHRPLTDFWRVGHGYAARLESCGLYTMGDIARCSLGKKNEYHNEDLLYQLFGINAELLIDHAWGWESCTLAEVKAYKPQMNSLGSGQVLQCPYEAGKAKLIVREMTDLLVLELVDKGLVTDQLVLYVGYDIENLSIPEIRRKYKGTVTTDHYGRQVPKGANGSTNLERPTSSSRLIIDAVMELYDKIVNPELLVRRINITAGHILEEAAAQQEQAREASYVQLDLFTDYEAEQRKKAQEQAELDREKRMQQAVLNIKKKYGKNAILKGMNLEEGAMTVERNKQIGGHKA